MKMNPAFSIIMTSFNYAPYIGAAIESVLTQTFRDWELLIVDDCSTDDSWQIIQNFKDPRIKAHRHSTNMGACAAYNLALSNAQGDYIACLDSDDLFMPSKLERQADFLAQHPDIGICGTFVTEIDGMGAIKTGATPYTDWFNVSLNLNESSSWLWENRVCHSSTVVRKNLHERLGKLDNRLVYTPDWQFWLRALASGARFAVIEESLVAYRNHGQNITHKNRQGTLLEHAVTCAHTLVPWLVQHGHKDLIEVTLQGFLDNSLLALDGDVQIKCVNAIFSGTEASEIGSAIMRLALRQKAKFAELHEGKTWLESQWTTGRTDLLAKDIQLAELQACNSWLASQREAWERTALEREQSIVALSDRLEEVSGKLAAHETTINKIRSRRGMRAVNFFFKLNLF